MSEAYDSLFTVTVQPQGDRVCVVLVGELDLASSGQIERELIAQLDQGCAAVELDMRELTFIDSSGIHELLRCRGRAAERDVRLTLAVVPGPVRRALQVSGVVDAFEIELREPS